jgi:integrase
MSDGAGRLAGLTEPKSTAGIRSVPVCEQLYDILDEHLLRVAWSEGFAFSRTATTPFAYGAARWQAESAYAKAGLQPSDLQLHECRHSFSSWLAAAGVPLERRNLYRGHADLSMDARYTHMVDHQYLDDARALGDYLRRADSPARIEHATGARTGAQVAETA